MAGEAGVEFVRLDEGWEYATTPRYWFKDSRGHEIVARDLEELKWKLSLIQPHSLPQTRGEKFRPGEIVMYKGEKVRVSEQIGDRVNIFIPSRQELVWVKPEALERVTAEPIKPEFWPEVKGKVYFIGSCKVSEGMCLTHGYSVSETVRCPRSLLTDEEWKAAFELAKTAFPEGQHNPWVNGWWPETLEEAERAVKYYSDSLWDAYRKFEFSQRRAIENYARSRDKAIYYYRDYVMREYERGKELRRKPREEVLAGKPAIVPVEKRPRREGDLEYLADSPEFLTQTIDAIGYRNKLDSAFQDAIRRAKGLK
jgi:hypothetical protein